MEELKSLYEQYGQIVLQLEFLQQQAVTVRNRIAQILSKPVTPNTASTQVASGK